MAVDMRSPGIEIRPLRQITGHAHFNEVFLTDVRIPAANVVGGANKGWGVAQTTLGNERQMIGGCGSGIGFKSLLALAQRCGRTDEAVIRQELAKSYTRFELINWMGQRAKARAKAGLPPGPEASLLKLMASQRVELDGSLVLALEGADGMLLGADAPADGTYQQLFLNQWSVRIGGGTEQIQRNVIGERVLGLPGEARPDKTLPFRDLPRN
jgi:alkylation response protein AidB-like acyl-CoA dehydrogenase